jgi:hypothetical protein
MKGETIMGDSGKKDKGKREEKKKAKLNPKEKRKLKNKKNRRTNLYPVDAPRAVSTQGLFQSLLAQSLSEGLHEAFRT